MRNRLITARARRSAVAVAAGAGLAASLLSAAPAQAVSLGGYVVTFSAPPSSEDLEALSAVAGSVHGFRYLPAAAVVAPLDTIGLIRAMPHVKGVYANSSIHLLDAASVSALNGSGVGAGTALPYDGSGVSIGVIDAGVDGTHPDLCAAATFCKGTPVKTIQNVDVIGKQDSTGGDPITYLENQVTTDHSSGHGSHVAGIAAGYGVASETPGLYRGVATGASVVGLGTGEVAEVWNVLGAFDWAIGHKDQYGIRVLNNSWGPGYGTAYDPDDPVNGAIDAAWNAGISVVFGSGNDGPRTDALNAFSVNPHAISVAASDSVNQLAFFSSRGIPGSPFWHPTVTAPGNNIVSVRTLTGALTAAADASSGTTGVISPADTPYYAVASGTSMASPQVAGVIAVMQQAAHSARGVWLTPSQVKDILQATARRALPTYQAYSMGAGIVDLTAAVQAAKSGVWTTYSSDAVYDVKSFTGTVGGSALGNYTGLSSFSASYAVRPGAVSLDVMADWGTYPQIVDMDVTSPSGAVTSTFLRCDPTQQPNGYSAFCSSQPNQRLSFPTPEAGTWTVRAYGTATASDTVHGLWSAAYPPGTAVSTGTPASIVLSAKTPASVTGQLDELKATVLDAAGNPVPDMPLTWSASGVGSVRSTELWSRSTGGATAQAASDLPGNQVVTVRAGAASASVAITWAGVVLPSVTPVGPTPPPPSTPGKGSGGGWWLEGGAKHKLTVSGAYTSGAQAPSGQYRFDDGNGNTVAADGVDRFNASGSAATLVGACTYNGASGYRCTLTVTDNGEPGKDHDTARLTVTKPTDPMWKLDTGGTVGGGNYQVSVG
ncbi:MAG: serine protease AprX [Frankiaceae bacterium]|nr:serine protease AprX [Frankiaceae bacterium]